MAKWEKVLRVSVADWRVKRMKTKWGSCTAGARRIWLNLELAVRARRRPSNREGVSGAEWCPRRAQCSVAKGYHGKFKGIEGAS